MTVRKTGHVRDASERQKWQTRATGLRHPRTEHGGLPKTGHAQFCEGSWQIEGLAGWSLSASTEGRVRGNIFEKHVGPKIIMRNCSISTENCSLVGINPDRLGKPEVQCKTLKHLNRIEQETKAFYLHVLVVHCALCVCVCVGGIYRRVAHRHGGHKVLLSSATSAESSSKTRTKSEAGAEFIKG